MVNQGLVQYVLYDILSVDDSEDLIITFPSETEITVLIGGKTYVEPTFDVENLQLDEVDFGVLDKLMDFVSNIENTGTINRESINVGNIRFIKLCFFFVNEHYLTFPRVLDIHGRVSSKSVNDKYLRYLEFPVVDVLKHQFHLVFCKDLPIEKTLFLTTDLDFIDLWKYLGLWKTIYRIGRHLLHGRWKTFSYEVQSLFKSREKLEFNPLLLHLKFETSQLKNINVKKIAFLHNSRSSTYDFENDLEMNSFREFLQTIGKDFELAIHPSYNTRFIQGLMRDQVTHYAKTLLQDPQLSRFHYLNCDYPNDLDCLLGNGISTDFSFYFADSMLFRGGISSSFKMWSVERNEPVMVNIIPITVMDVTLSEEFSLSFHDARELSIKKVKRSLMFGSSCCLLWHNNNMYKEFSKENYLPQLFTDILLEISNIK